MKLSYISLFLLIVSLFFSCSIEVADGGNTSDIGNAKILGKIVDESGSPVNNAQVTLNEKTDTIFYYHGTGDTLITFDTSVSTDSKGAFVFNLPDSGMYHITVEKYKRFLVFIDSVHVFDTFTIILPTDTVKAPGVVTGTVLLEDTAGITDKQIRVLFKEKTSYAANISHGETFIFSDIPRGFYGILYSPQSVMFVPKWEKVKVTPGDTTDVGTITLQKITNYLASSNVMTTDFMGLDSVPVDIIPEYTFTIAVKSAEAKAVQYPEEIVIATEPVVNGNTLTLNPQENFARGREIGVYLTVTLAGREEIAIDFLTDPKKRFRIIP